jgi:hypothetical protein
VDEAMCNWAENAGVAHCLFWLPRNNFKALSGLVSQLPTTNNQEVVMTIDLLQRDGDCAFFV